MSRTSEVSPSLDAVQLNRVAQTFGQFIALRDLTLTLPAGSSVMLLGENGAGKSTLLRLLAGLSSPTHGELRVLGADPHHLRGRIAYMGHATMLYDELTAPENLLFFLHLGTSRALPVKEAEHTVRAALRSVGLDPANPRRVGEYSQGMRQRASLARVLLSDPDLLLLDEPFSNLDAASAQAMIARLHGFLATPGSHGHARTLLFTTHQAELARPLASTTLTLRGGRLASMEHRPAAAGSAPSSESRP